MLNKVIVIGNLGRDPEVRTLPNSDRNVANLSVATKERFKDRDGHAPCHSDESLRVNKGCYHSIRHRHREYSAGILRRSCERERVSSLG